MTVLLTDNLPLLSGAPNGIKKLRELILELAVRGKLVPQEANDEPASELLKRIAEEKTRLISEEGLRTTAREDIPETEYCFTLHAGWAVCRLGNLARFIDYRGRTPTKTLSGVPLLTAKNVRSGFISREPQEFIANTDYMSWMTRGFPRAGDMLFTTEAPMGNVALIDISEKFALAQRVICFQLHQLSTGPFLKLAMMSSGFQTQLSDVATGMTATGIKSSRLKEIPVPLPPLAEQHRIVAKVDELMALCDRLEAQQADAESAHAQLVKALLDSLTQASAATDFAANWQRLAEHFHTLFTTESSIDALKQTLLQLAVMGKLVPQDPNDEPTSELLNRIAEEKARLVAEGKIRKTKQLPEVTDEDKSSVPPNGWEAVRFGQVIELISGQHLGPDEYFASTRNGAIPYLTGPADFGETYPRPTRFTHERRAISVEGDILLTVKGSGVGKTNFVDQKEFAISRQLMAIRPILVDTQFARNMLLSMSEYFQSRSIGIAIPGISREDVLDTLIGLPPLPEQHRIVSKVDELMALCDQLKARLTQARQLNEQLASTLVEQAVA